MATAPALQKRLASLDQFRGYTVAGMFLVNYLGHYFKATPFILQHHNTYCSYADTIMPEFFFAVGFAFRLSFGRREHEQGLPKAYWHVVKRLIGLALVAIVVYQASPRLPKGAEFNWATMRELGIWGAIWPGAIKGTWFQTLMHIAVTSLWILPVIRARASWRVVYMIVSALLHLGLSDVFYFQWVNGEPHSPPTGIDGGPLGFLTWTIPTMLGTLACDVVMSQKSRGGILTRVIGWGIVLMALSWGASCLTRCYDVPDNDVDNWSVSPLSKNPVFPKGQGYDDWVSNLKAGKWSAVLAERPFVPPPYSREMVEVKEKDKDKKSDDAEAENGSADASATKAGPKMKEEDQSALHRKWNYWMMSQRCGTITYLTFGGGISLVIYGLFYLLSDVIGLKVGVFRTLGSNALFGYVLHDIISDSVRKFFPRDSPPIAMWTSFAIFFFLCWLFIRSLEKKNIYIKL